MRGHFKDVERCTVCGGRCCRIYLSCHDGGSRPETEWFNEWVMQWEAEFDYTGANAKVKPNFDPLEVHSAGNEHMLEELKARWIDPDACKFLGKVGCLLDEEQKPSTCKEFRCYDWRKEDNKVTL